MFGFLVLAASSFLFDQYLLFFWVSISVRLRFDRYLRAGITMYELQCNSIYPVRIRNIGSSMSKGEFQVVNTALTLSVVSNGDGMICTGGSI